MTETKTEEKVKEKSPPKPKFGSRPPKDGPCKRCGKDKPLNRKFMCYSCFVITNLEDRAKDDGDIWVPGMPHPASCNCDGLGAHTDRGGSSGSKN